MSAPLAHIAGVPVEESMLALAPAGAAMVSLVVLRARARLTEIVRWRRRR